MTVAFTIGAGQLAIRHGDVTQLAVDALVNAANSRLAGGGGVDHAIHCAAGMEKMQKACRDIIDEIGELPAGKAVITPGFDLMVRQVIHTVGPIWRGGTYNEPQLLHSAYWQSLLLAAKHGVKSIAFPAISCGVYGYPQEAAARIALLALHAGLRDGLVQDIYMVLHTPGAYALWQAMADNLFSNTEKKDKSWN